MVQPFSNVAAQQQGDSHSVSRATASSSAQVSIIVVVHLRRRRRTINVKDRLQMCGYNTSWGGRGNDGMLQKHNFI